MSKSSFYKSLFIVFFLGLSSGLPLSLILSTLKALLIEKGFNIKNVGFFALVTIPYSLKIFFAPIIDSYKIPFLTKAIGHRKSWIITSQVLLLLTISLLGMSAIYENLFFIAIFAVLVAISSASQDIVIDGYRIELFKEEDQGPASAFYIYGYRIGILISGAGALALATIVAWHMVYFFMSLTMLCFIIITFGIEETRQKFKKDYISFNAWFRRYVIVPFFDIFKRRKYASIILAMIFFFKLADAFAGNLILPFLLDIGYTKIEIATSLKLFGFFAVLAGVAAGGLLIKNSGIFKVLWVALTLQILSNVAFCYLAISNKNFYDLYLIIFFENFSGGIGDATLVAYLSGLCNKKYSATQYALLASIGSLARSILSSTAGIYAQSFGWFNFFAFSATLGLPAMLCLFLLTILNKPINFR